MVSPEGEYLEDAMTNAATEPDLRDLILAIDRKIDTRFNELDKKIDTRFYELDKKIDTQYHELDKRIDGLDKKIDVQITEVKAEIRRLEEKIDGFGKRIDQQEFINRGAILALIAGVTTGFIKYLFFPN